MNPITLPMNELKPALAGLSKIIARRPTLPVLGCIRIERTKTNRIELTGTLIVARDAAHARIRQMLDRGEPMPDFFKNHPIYYAGPAKTPDGMASGSFGPTTAGRMDSFVDLFQSKGGSLITETPAPAAARH